jgi:hypothetical protein
MSLQSSPAGTAAIIALVVAGCGQLTTRPDADLASVLPAARAAADSVALEIAFVRTARDGGELGAPLWTELDEQHLPAEVRRRLGDNGLRCGLTGTQLPTVLHKLLAERPVEEVDAGTTELSLGGEAAPRPRRVHLRAGQRSEIVTSATLDEMVILHRDDGALRGESFEQGQCVLVARAYPQGDGRVRLELTPEVQFGRPRQRWVGQEGMFRVETRRDRRVYEPLAIDAYISSGQTLVLAATPEAKGLGRQMFTDPSGNDDWRKLLLIRLAQGPSDDLFAPLAAAPSAQATP